MTKTKIAALLSVLALLASLPLTVALAQGAPYLVIGTAMVDDEPAMMGTMVVAMVGDEKVGSGEVFDAMGHYRLLIGDGNPGDTVMISLMMGEGDEMMEYMASTDGDVMIGASGESMMADLMAYSGEQPAPTARPRPTKSADQILNEKVNAAVRNAMRDVQPEPGPQGEPGPAGADGSDGARGAAGPAGADGSDGSDGSDGARGAAGAAGADGSDGSDGSDGARGGAGSAGSAGPAGSDGATGPAGPAGSAGADGGGGVLAIVALIIAIVGVVAAGGAFIAGRQSR